MVSEDPNVEKRNEVRKGIDFVVTYYSTVFTTKHIAGGHHARTRDTANGKTIIMKAEAQARPETKHAAQLYKCHKIVDLFVC